MSTPSPSPALTPEAGRVLYVAEPIDQSNMGAWKSSVAQIIRIANDRGWLCFRPAGAWRIGDMVEVGHEIEAVNRHVLFTSRAVIAFLPTGVPSIGVPREVEWAIANGTPVLVLTDNDRAWSLADVTTCKLDDVIGFGQWITQVEKLEAVGLGFAFALDGTSQLPTRSNDGDAGYDLYVSQTTTVQPGEFADVPCDLRVALPFGVWARITGRSSTLRKRKLLVAEGIIDNGYRGPLYSGVFNLGGEPHTVQAGERIAQLILHENTSARYLPLEVDPRYFERIPGDSRGTDGFGSTGL